MLLSFLETALNASLQRPKNATRLYLALAAAGVLTAIVVSFADPAIAQFNDTTTAAISPSDPLDPRYYQDYQSVVVPTIPVESANLPAVTAQAPAPGQIPLPPPSPAVLPPAIAPFPGETTPPPPTVPPADLSDPMWVRPSAPVVTPQTVTVPPPVAIPPATDPLPPTAAPPPATVIQPATSPATAPRPGELALQVTDLQILGVDPDLQAYATRIIQTRVGGQTTSTQLQNDVAALENSGFFSTAFFTTRQNPQGVSVAFTVTPLRLQALQLSNARALSLSVANQIFQNQFGQPINPALLNQAINQINEWYTQNGYILARVVGAQPTPQGVVVIEVAEGRIADVEVRFVDRQGRTVDDAGRPIRYRTQDAFVRRQIQLQQGDVFQVNVARSDLQRLEALGIFEQANVTFEGDALNTKVVYNLQERPPRDLRFGGGYNDALGLFGSVNIQDVNFGGLGQRLGGNILIGTRDIQFDGRFVSPYRETEPNVPGYSAGIFRRQGFSNVFTDEITLPNGDRVRERRYGINAGIERPLGGQWVGNWALNYTNVSIRDQGGRTFATDAQNNPLTLSGTGVDDLFSFSFTGLRDLRNNPVNPSSGNILRVDTEQFLPVGRGNVLGTRLQANYSQFIPIKLITANHATPPNPAESQPEVFAFNVQGGTYVGDLPPYNAFVLGGPFSVRGWETGAIATSRSYVEASAEYRFPIYRFIGGAAFVDFASDLGSSNDVLGEPGVVRDKPGTGLGFGFGVRVNSPFGILRGDLGFSNAGDVRFQFGFGQRF